MKITRIQDKYNDSKVWIIKKTKCRHYYLAQEIKGQQVCKFARLGKKWAQHIGLELA